MGALLGPGNGGNTTWGDVKQDGITNPPPLCASDGLSTGQICNNHPSQVSDDDGGYMRTMGQAYYQSPCCSRRPAGRCGCSSAHPQHPRCRAAGRWSRTRAGPGVAPPPTLDRPPPRIQVGRRVWSRRLPRRGRK